MGLLQSSLFDKKDTAYNVKLIRSGNQLEKYEYKRPIRLNIKASSERIKTRKTAFSQGKREDNVKRAKKKLVRLVLSNTENYKGLFITLTYADNVTDRGRVLRDFAKFTRSLRRRYYNAKYIYVLEKQKRGAWHVHVLIFNISYISFTWLDKAWPHGLTNTKSTNNSKHSAYYLAKYLGKDVQKKNKRVFTASRGLIQPTILTFLVMRDEVITHITNIHRTKLYKTPTGNLVRLTIYYYDNP